MGATPRNPPGRRAQAIPLPNGLARDASRWRRLVGLAGFGASAFPAAAAGPQGFEPLGIPLEFELFGLTLVGVAVLHRHALAVALAGLVSILGCKLLTPGSAGSNRLASLGDHLAGEWVVLANLLGLLLGFALIAQHFQKSGAPALLPRYLPCDWKGAFALLVIVFVLSSFLDNIAAALVGGAVAHSVFRAKVHVGYLAGIVAASNAGGAGSVIGDTTTTMMWIHGVSPATVMPAYIASVVALIIFGIPASLQQDRYSPISKDGIGTVDLDWPRIGIVAAVLVVTVGTNTIVNARYPARADSFPFIGAAVWVVLGVFAPVRQPDWTVLPSAFKGAVFLLALVLCASLMPVEKLPTPSWQSAFGLGAVSAVFDNIPLTALTLKQGGYDWGVLAYAVGFGGSMLWFGSSSGVALSNMFPEVRSIRRWMRDGWHVALAYFAGFVILLWLVGWHPDPQ